MLLTANKSQFLSFFVYRRQSRDRFRICVNAYFGNVDLVHHGDFRFGGFFLAPPILFFSAAVSLFLLMTKGLLTFSRSRSCSMSTSVVTTRS